MGTPIPPNRAAFLLDELLRATGGVIGSGLVPGEGVTTTSVSTDTRTLTPESVFVALRGETFDGHHHLAEAAAAGASVAIVERVVRTPPPELIVVRVPSTLEALGALGRHHARRWRSLGAGRRLVAITGSAGKTTTRVATAALFERLRPGQVHASHGNLNNRIGLPMVLLGLGPEHVVGLVEMGMSQPGEIAQLVAIAEPEAGIATLVAAAHTERVGTIDDVGREKGVLLRALPEDGVAIGNGDDPYVRRAMEASPARRRRFYGHTTDADVRILGRELVSVTRAKLTLSFRSGSPTICLTTPLLGEAGALACAAAIAAADGVLDVRVDGELATAAFAEADVGAGAGRLVPRLLADGLAIVDDSYNANPASTCASIRAATELALHDGRRLLLVLGEMLELGALADPGHDEVGRAAAASGAAAVVAVGGAARRIADRAGEAGVASSFHAGIESATEAVLALARPADLILVKGSRGVATERIVAALTRAHGAAASGPGVAP